MIEQRCNTVTVDGRLEDGEIDGPDGKRFIELVRAKLPETRIIGLSGRRLSRRVDIDFDLGKFDMDDLLKVAQQRP